MTNTNSTSNEQLDEKLTIDIGDNSSTLRCIIRNTNLLHQTGYDKINHKVTYVGNTADMSYLENAADATITTLALGISSIGKLMVSQDKKMTCINDNDIDALSWLLVDLGSAIVELQNIQIMAGDAVRGAKRNN